MVKILTQCSEDKEKIYWVEIPSFDGEGSTLYVLNGDGRPQSPVAGDFVYDYGEKTFEIYYGEFWKRITVEDGEDQEGYRSGWWWRRASGRKDVPEFGSVEEVLGQFGRTFDSERLKVIRLEPPEMEREWDSLKRKIGEAEMEVEGDEIGRAIWDLVVELELDGVLRDGGGKDGEEVERAWKELIGDIELHMAQSTSVVVQGWTLALKLKWSKDSMGLQFGNLGQRWQWIDGILYKKSRENEGKGGVSDKVEYHKMSTMEEFMDLTEDMTVCGNFLDGNDLGAKVWAVMRPKHKLCPNSLDGISEAFVQATTLSPEGTFSDADIATVCLEEGDIMFQPPGVLHCVYTPVPAVFSGGYFYNYQTFHLTHAVLSIPYKDQLTNDGRLGFFHTLCQMPNKFRGRRPGPYDTSDLADEERGEMSFAEDCASYCSG
ncbi:hypothetical protein BS17DRAFT_769872 [Gyrodon lividus]|nr:hypothetical protein BS17DRAFT_769872 [Gyrodon lividus]